MSRERPPRSISASGWELAGWWCRGSPTACPPAPTSSTRTSSPWPAPSQDAGLSRQRRRPAEARIREPPPATVSGRSEAAPLDGAPDGVELRALLAHRVALEPATNRRAAEVDADQQRSEHSHAGHQLRAYRPGREPC